MGWCCGRCGVLFRLFRRIAVYFFFCGVLVVDGLAEFFFGMVFGGEGVVLFAFVLFFWG